jgi:hypothetical protein
VVFSILATALAYVTGSWDPVLLALVGLFILFRAVLFILLIGFFLLPVWIGLLVWLSYKRLFKKRSEKETTLESTG